VESIISDYCNLGGLTDVRGSVAIGGSVDHKNYPELVIVSMIINTQPACSIDDDVLFVSFVISGKEI